MNFFCVCGDIFIVLLAYILSTAGGRLLGKSFSFVGRMTRRIISTVHLDHALLASFPVVSLDLSNVLYKNAFGQGNEMRTTGKKYINRVEY